MRTLKLTHEQIALIQQALGIAEHQFTCVRKDIFDLINVRNNEAFKPEQTQISNYYHVKACEFADLNVALKNGELDK